MIMSQSLKLSGLNVFGTPLDSLGHLGMLKSLKKSANWPSKHTLWKNPTFGWFYVFLVTRKMLSGLKIVYRGHFLKFEFNLADPRSKK